MIIFPRRGGIRERQTRLTDFPIGFFERHEARPQSSNAAINIANIIMKPILIIMPRLQDVKILST
jgi:hypothetical protein